MWGGFNIQISCFVFRLCSQFVGIQVLFFSVIFGFALIGVEKALIFLLGFSAKATSPQPQEMLPGFVLKKYVVFLN